MQVFILVIYLWTGGYKLHDKTFDAVEECLKEGIVQLDDPFIVNGATCYPSLATES